MRGRRKPPPPPGAEPSTEHESDISDITFESKITPKSDIRSKVDNVYLLVWSQYGHEDEVKSHSITVDDSTTTDPMTLVVDDSTLAVSDVDSYAGWARVYAMYVHAGTSVTHPRCVATLRWDALGNPHWQTED